MAPATDLRQGVAEATRMARVTLVLLAGCAAVNLAALGVAGWRPAATGRPASLAVATTSDFAFYWIDQLQLGVCFATGMLLLFWVYRSYANLRLLGTGETRYAPGWAVGYWFAPMINLIVPCLVVQELWVRSATANASREPRTAVPLVRIWWAVSLGANLLLVWHPWSETAESLLTTKIVFDVFALVSSVLTALIVRRISTFQRRALEPAVESPPATLEPA